jgi:membrane fusion protein (multidrug efflux system)
MRKRLLITAALVVLAGVSFYVLNNDVLTLRLPGASKTSAQPSASQERRQQRRPAPVEIAEATASVSTSEIQSIGSLMSDESVEVTTETAGRVKEILFEEGHRVNAGDVLVRLDDSLLLAELKDAEARLGLAQSTYDRSRALQKTGAATKQSFDEAVSNLQVARAAVDLARTRAAKMQIEAPFGGILGFRTVSVGAYVTAGSKLVNLEKIDELKVGFSVPEVFLSQLSPGQRVDITVDAWPGEVYEGSVYAINPHVDINGRALQVRATLTNHDLKLRPGLLARVVVKGKDENHVVMVPESAIVPRGGETIVFRLENGKVFETPVKLGLRRNGEVEILHGLEAKTQVVTAGQAQLKNGGEVEIVTPLQGAGG